MAPPTSTGRRSIFSDGIDMLESSLANVNFGGVDNRTMDDLLSSTYSAIGNLEALSPDCLPTIPISIEAPEYVPASREGYPVLPQEIILHILSFVRPDNQQFFANACKVSRTWYHAAIGHLYARPYITTGKYEKFIAQICPTVTHTKHSPLAEFIKSLDLSHLLYDGKSSYTARLLRRTAPNLEEFIAPATKFGYSCMVALGNCHQLRVLDLRLVTQSLGLVDLFQTMSRLKELRNLTFPRSLMMTTGEQGRTFSGGYNLPEKLECFCLTGNVSDTFLTTVNVSENLTELRIAHAFARHGSIKNLLNRWSSQLKVLEINYHISTLPHNAMDKILVTCLGLEKLRIAVDFVSHRLFDEENTPVNHPLKRLDLDSSGYLGAGHKLNADHIFICLAEGRLPHLRILRISEKLNWKGRDAQGLEDLAVVLESRETGPGEIVGVWEFDTIEPGHGKF
ncbi:hypothetical protein L211DRAFT_835802 [Terfezia boudieri ATCC MYA-4762]|uniref:F-box domain-containing protein n=1 Tax=Terfezia boudieri ATCC MYA-4762 TaxID=1051890 RepID=A0A3N4LYI8_9PEZI|nr:hypothetical protein L211DRAFT_835802 [Terfezia boudieri ATCC MYA-4762]